MRRWLALLPVSIFAVTTFQCTDGAGAVRKHVKAHEQALHSLAEEWLRDGPFQMTHGSLNAPLAGSPGWNLRLDDGWLVMPRGDFTTRLDDAMWFWPAAGSGWWMQNERNVDVAPDGLNTYRPAIRVSTLEEREKYAAIPSGRLEAWMKAVTKLGIRSIGLDPYSSPPHSPMHVRLTFDASDMEGVFFKTFGDMEGQGRTTVQQLWGPWYYFKQQPAVNPL